MTNGLTKDSSFEQATDSVRNMTSEELRSYCQIMQSIVTGIAKEAGRSPENPQGETLSNTVDRGLVF